MNVAISQNKDTFRIYLLSFMWFIISATQIEVFSQAARRWSSSEIFHKMKKLSVVGSALYVAAHPDDENTRLLTYLANEKKLHTTYISMTRGDGGQNLLGPEIGPVMGVLRTQELLEARKIEGTHQLFTRANDFGFSKNGEETMNIWDTDDVTADVVWAIRQTKPDVIINRFDHRTSGRTHGHHTASALIAIDAFDKAGDGKNYPEQLPWVSVWQPQRLFYNTSWWAYGSMEAFEKADKSLFVSQNTGVFYPHLGEGNSEIGARARSMHKCQGFGSTGSRGDATEYMELIKGDLPPSQNDILEGINTSWSRLEGGEKIEKMVQQLIQSYDFRQPELSVPALGKIYEAIGQINDPFWRKIKQEEVVELILACCGIYAEARTPVHKSAPGDELSVEIEFSQENKGPVNLLSVTGLGESFSSEQSESKDPRVLLWKINVILPENTPYTLPYWLWKKGTLGMLEVDRQEDIGKPLTDKTVTFRFLIRAGDVTIPFDRELIHQYTDPKQGTTYRPLEIIPALSVKPQTPVMIFPDGSPREIAVSLHAWSDGLRGTLSLPVPQGWSVSPSNIEFNMENKDTSQDFIFTVTPPAKAAETTITPVARIGEQIFDGTLTDIDYDHIPYQVVRMPAEIKIARLNIENYAQKIAYIMGAGDDIPMSLRSIGCQVDIIEPAQISADFLEPYDAVVLGVRAYNTVPELKYKQPILFEYIEKGGNVLVQYNVNRRLVTDELSPYPLSLSRNRVTMEDSEVRIINPQHPALNTPNKIGAEAFDGWVQERGLYFPDKWDEKFSPLISCNDKNENAQDGSILVAPYGKGHYIYTGISFFRQLPAGVSGAYLLFANLISLGKNGQ